MRLVVTSMNIDSIKAGLPPERRDSVRLDDYLTRLIKYIPSEVVTLYVAAYSLLNSVTGVSVDELSWAVLVVGIVATPLYLWRVAKVTNVLQVVVSTLAFLVWAFALGRPFSSLPWYQPIYGSLALMIYTFFIPIILAK